MAVFVAIMLKFEISCTIFDTERTLDALASLFDPKLHPWPSGFGIKTKIFSDTHIGDSTDIFTNLDSIMAALLRNL